MGLCHEAVYSLQIQIHGLCGCHLLGTSLSRACTPLCVSSRGARLDVYERRGWHKRTLLQPPRAEGLDFMGAHLPMAFEMWGGGDEAGRSPDCQVTRPNAKIKTLVKLAFVI